MSLNKKLNWIRNVFIDRKEIFLILLITLVLQWVFIISSDLIVDKILKIKLATQNINSLQVGDYSAQLRNLNQTGSLITPDGGILNKYPPAYPYFLFAILRVSQYSGISFEFLFLLASSLVISITSLGIYKITRKLIVNRRLAFFSVIVFVSHPYILQGLYKPMSETLFNLFFVFSILTFFELIVSDRRGRQNAVIWGILTGLSMLTRPIALFIPIVYIIIIYLNRKSINIPWKGILLFIFTLTIMLLPWELFNYNKTNKIIPLASSSSAAFNDGINFNHHPVKEKIKLPPNVVLLTDELLYLNTEEDKYFIKVTNKFLHRPIATVQLFLIKSMRSWYGVMEQNRKKEIIKLIIFIIYILPCLGIILRKSKKMKINIFNRTFLALTIYFWLITIAVVSMARYMIPVFLLATIYYSILFEKYFIKKSKTGFNLGKSF